MCYVRAGADVRRNDLYFSNGVASETVEEMTTKANCFASAKHIMNQSKRPARCVWRPCSLDASVRAPLRS